MKMILMSVLLSAQVERLSASRMQEFFLEIGFMKQHIFLFFLHGNLFTLFYLYIYISYVKWNWRSALYYILLHCGTLY